MSCRDCYHYYKSEKYCPIRQLHTLPSDNCKEWKCGGERESAPMFARFSTNGYYIYDNYKNNKWLVNEVEADEIVEVMNNLDTKARERSKALSKLQKANDELNDKLETISDMIK